MNLKIHIITGNIYCIENLLKKKKERSFMITYMYVYIYLYDTVNAKCQTINENK